MTAPLDQAIRSLTDPSVAIGDALRGLLVVSRRIKATELTDWIQAELTGYDSDAALPKYRRQPLPIELRWDGFGGSRSFMTVGAGEIPEVLAPADQPVRLTHPVAELSALAGAEGDTEPRFALPLAWVALYRHFIKQGELIPHIQNMVLNEAYVIAPRTFLLGLVDQVKTAALDLALDLEGVSPEAGSSGGPTVESDKELASVVNIHMNTINANNSTVVLGDGNTSVNVQVGDLDGMLKAAATLIAQDGLAALREAIEADGGEPDKQTRSVLDRVKAGAFTLVGGITTNAAYEGLVQLVQAAYPNFT